MLRKKYILPVVSLLVLIILNSACIASPTPFPPTPTQPAAQAEPTQTALPIAVNQPTETTAPTEKPVDPAVHGFVLFNKEKGEFQAFAPDGSLLFISPAPGSDYPSAYTTSIVNDAVYYLIPRSLAKNQQAQLLRSSAAGVEKITAVPAEKISALAVSPNETWMAWSTLGPEEPISELWLTNLKTSESRKLASYTYQQDEAFFLRPFAWAKDGKLLFERALTGIGGYILFSGHNSLYTYDPITGAIETIVPAEEKHGLCLDSFHPDQAKVIFICGKGKQEVTIRDLKDQSEKTIPPLPGQGVAGTARYSPSGKWLVYAVAANNPNNESGQLVIVPADLSAPPQVIAQVKDNMYLAVQGWLDEDTLVLNRNQWPESTTWTINRDGSGLKQIASGFWMGWLPGSF